jgi:hypothetical protein
MGSAASPESDEEASGGKLRDGGPETSEIICLRSTLSETRALISSEIVFEGNIEAEDEKAEALLEDVIASLSDGQKRKADVALELGIKREDRTLARALSKGVEAGVEKGVADQITVTDASKITYDVHHRLRESLKTSRT